jgi:hypothetical protein
MWQKEEALLNLCSMLDVDSFHGHTVEEVKKALNQKYGSSCHPWRTDTDVAKAGCLYKLAI